MSDQQSDQQSDQDQIKALHERWLVLAHGMQTGVAYEQQFNPKDGTPKHLRTGINTALCDHAGLIRLLIDKGIISELEYYQAIVVEMEKEVERYVQRLKEYYGTDVDIELL